MAHTRDAAPRRAAGTMARALFALASTLALAQPMHARAACITKIDMPVTIVGGRAVAMVGIKGTQVPLTVDSGAFYSMITDAAAQQLQLETSFLNMRIMGIAGEAAARMTTVDKLQFVGGAVPDVEFIVAGNEPGAGTMGLLGRNLLTFTDVEFDLANGMISFLFPTGECEGKNMAYWAGDKPITVLDVLRPNNPSKATRSPEIAVRVKINGKPVRAVLDTGAHSMLTLRAAHGAGIADADMTAKGSVYGVGEGRRKAWTAKIAQFEIGDEAISNSQLSIADHDGPDMLLGIDFFLSHHIYVSRKQRRIYMTYNGGPVFDLNTLSEQDRAATQGEAAPADAEGFLRRAAVRERQRDTAGALADLDRACALAPTDARCFARRGSIRLASKQVDAARTDFDTAIRLDPAQADARLYRAGLAVVAHRRDDALADLQALDASIPAQSNLRSQMGDLYLVLDLPAQALPQWSQWLTAHPNEISRDHVQNALCWARLRLGRDLDKALDECDDAVDRVPDNAAYLDSRAWAHLRLGNGMRSRRDFDHSIKLNPNGAWSLYGRGLLRTRNGDPEGGRADLEAARKLEKDIDDKVRKSGVAGDLLPPVPVTAAAAASNAAR